MKVVYSQDAHDYLQNLIIILLNKEYFSFQDVAEKYVDDLRHYIETHIDKTIIKQAPPRFKKFGFTTQYITYKRNKHTTWYIFFIKHNDVYFITHITNNQVAAHHIRGLES